MLRTNVDFILGNENKKVIMITSMNQGSGKSFISANLASCSALRDKKVIVLDLDLRRATLSKICDSPKHGLSDYFNGKIKSWKDILVKSEENDGYNAIQLGFGDVKDKHINKPEKGHFTKSKLASIS